MSSGTGVRLELLVCSSVGSTIAIDLGGEAEPERPAAADHCVLCFAPGCAPPAATTYLVAAGPGNDTAAVAPHGSAHLPDPPRWLKVPVRAPPASIS